MAYSKTGSEVREHSEFRTLTNGCNILLDIFEKKVVENLKGGMKIAAYVHIFTFENTFPCMNL